MKDIGSELEAARLAMGISIDEAAEDLKLKPSQLENIEKGNHDAFRDVFELKQAIRDYAKYLSLEYEKLEDEFNEFVFEYTSKIPLDEIAKANEEKKVEKREIMSPYTLEYKRQFSFLNIVIVFLLLVISSFIVYIIYNNIENKENDTLTSLTYYIKGE